ncbi:MAG: YIP1 family protein [Candidatus Eremiobacteraeota bacterium]|nr:YIP1 family protein [Candidatus Eremiobacteraeota bacterium]
MTALNTLHPSEKPNGLGTYVSILTTPRAAFSQLTAAPTWGWAALIGIVLTLAAAIISLPVQIHLANAMQQAQVSQMPADQQAQAGAAMAKLSWATPYFIIGASLFGPWLGWLITAAVFLAGSAISGGQARWNKAWTAAVNAYIITGVATLVGAIIMRLRGPEMMTTVRDAYTLPSLAMLAHGGAKAAAFLYSYNIFYIWYYVIAVIALEEMMRLRRGSAVVTVVFLSLLGALLASAFAK